MTLTELSPTTAQPWPEGVFARYLTLAGATVDLSVLRTLHDTTYAASATCGGCGKQDEQRYDLYRSRGVSAPPIAEEACRKWAQSHAEHCRALPRP